jgi:hypothetical protein
VTGADGAQVAELVTQLRGEAERSRLFKRGAALMRPLIRNPHT